ncbi:MAG TPA: recombination protein RecR [Thiotrichales bacterium]|nr:recombination protein RecR [Thiotrichales bacterium]
MSETSLLQALVEALRTLPTVGPKTAQRMAFHLLERDREGALRLSEVLREAATRIGYCSRCRTFTEHEICRLCRNPARDAGQICVVETPADVVAIEQAAVYRGQYFVLHGRLSPLDGIGPQDLGLDLLEARLDQGGVEEIILATNPTVEGEVTAHYISDMAHARGIRTTRIAHGVPVGGELEYVDSNTLTHAFEGRKDY